MIRKSRHCSPPDFFVVYACTRFVQNKANDDRMRQSLLFRVCVCMCVSEEKERHKHGERNGNRKYVCMRVGVCVCAH